MQSWNELIDGVSLRHWMDERGLGAGAISGVAPLAGGTQNVLLRFRRGNRDFVLRRAAPGVRPDADALILREARFLKALGGSAVPHSTLLAWCDDPSIAGAAFFLMELVEGINPIKGLPPPLQSHDAQFAMGMALADGLASLAAIDIETAGLADLHRPGDYLARQVPRWLKQLDSYRQFDGWPGKGSLPRVDDIGNWLEHNRPETQRTGIVHGDCHIGNTLFRADRPELAAIIDWELATIGDPLVDLGTLVATWQEDDSPIAEGLRVSPWRGFPTASQLIDRYRDRSGTDIDRIDWYVVLACFRLAIICEGSFARAAAGLTDRETGEQLHQGALTLLDRAMRRLQGQYAQGS